MRALRITAAAAACAIVGTPALSQSWGSWDRAHAVARLDDFYVIKGDQPDDFCYVKQAYDNAPSRMELIYSSDRGLYLTTPFFRRLGQIIYEVDPVGNVPAHRLDTSYVEAPNLIRLPDDLVGQLERGRSLMVMVQIDGQWSHVQTFPLTGFTAARRQLSQAPCV